MELPEHGLEKSVWTQADYEVMGWHDAHLYSFVIVPDTWEMLLDLDYITRWVHPGPGEVYFKFWVAPVTLVFQEIQNIKVDIQMGSLQDLELFDLHKNPIPGNDSSFRWTLELSCGDIELDALSFTQVFRREPVLLEDQALGFEARGGVSFSRVPWDATAKDG